MTEVAPGETAASSFSANRDLIRIALHPDVTRDDVDDAMCARGWLLIQLVSAADDHPAQSIYLTKDRTGILYYVEDGHVGASYFVVRGADLARAASEVRQSVGTMSRSELVQMAASTREDDAARAILLLAIVTLDRDDEVFEILERSSTHDSPRVRNAAAIARRTLGAQPIGDEPGDVE